MSHIGTYAKEPAEGKDLLHVLQWRHSQQPQNQISACSLSPTHTLSLRPGSRIRPPALPPRPVEAEWAFTQQEGQGQAAGFLLQAAPGVPTDAENALSSRAAHSKEKRHRLLSWHFKNNLQSTCFQNRLEVRTGFLWNTPSMNSAILSKSMLQLLPAKKVTRASLFSTSSCFLHADCHRQQSPVTSGQTTGCDSDFRGNTHMPLSLRRYSNSDEYVGVT